LSRLFGRSAVSPAHPGRLMCSAYQSKKKADLLPLRWTGSTLRSIELGTTLRFCHENATFMSWYRAAAAASRSRAHLKQLNMTYLRLNRHHINSLLGPFLRRESARLLILGRTPSWHVSPRLRSPRQRQIGLQTWSPVQRRPQRYSNLLARTENWGLAGTWFSFHFFSTLISWWIAWTRWLSVCAWPLSRALAELDCLVNVPASSECSKMFCQNGLVLWIPHGHARQTEWSLSAPGAAEQTSCAKPRAQNTDDTPPDS